MSDNNYTLEALRHFRNLAMDIVSKLYHAKEELMLQSLKTQCEIALRRLAVEKEEEKHE